MQGILLVIHLIVAVSLSGLILLQSSKGGLAGGVGSGELYRSKRGAERVIFLLTITATVLFLITSLANILLR